MSGRFIVLTGATRGCGEALAREFVRLGHRVAGCGRDAARGEALAISLGAAFPFTRVDVTEAAAVAAWAHATLERFGPPSLLINNAAVMIPERKLWETDPADFARLIDINVTGAVNVIHAFLPAMIARREGVIVNFSSGWGRSVDAGFTPYCASKWAIEGLTRALALELPPGMAAVPLSPGMIDTDMLRAAFGAEAAAYPQPEAWARRAAPFLLRLSAKDNGQPLSCG